MKYRKLSVEELESLEKEFIQFLASNTVTCPDWEKIKSEKPDRAEELIEMFSDIVMEKALSNIKYLEHISPLSIKSFWFQKDKVSLIGIDVDPSENVDFTTPEGLKRLTETSNSSKPLKIYSTDKSYDKNREEELFEMLNKGCSIIKSEQFKAMHDMYQSTQTQKN